MFLYPELEFLLLFDQINKLKSILSVVFIDLLAQMMVYFVYIQHISLTHRLTIETEPGKFDFVCFKKHHFIGMQCTYIQSNPVGTRYREDV